MDRSRLTSCSPRSPAPPNRAQAPVLPPKPRSPVEQASLALAAASMLPLTALPALADEAAPAADAAAAAPSVLGFTPLGLALSFSPLVIYGGFYLYRQNINPRAKVRREAVSKGKRSGFAN